MESGRERGGVAFSKRHAAACQNVGALGDVARDATAAVGHGLQQAHGHALHVGGQHVGEAVGIQLLKRLAVDEAGEEDARVAPGELVQSRLVLRCVRAAAGDDELLVRIEPPERLDEELGALLGDEPTQIQEVGALGEAPPGGDGIRRARGLPVDPVGDDGRGAAVGFLEIRPCGLGEHDQPVRPGRGGPLSRLDVRAGEPAPLGALPVQPVDGRDRADARSLRQRQRHAGALGVVVDHVGPVLDRSERREER